MPCSEEHRKAVCGKTAMHGLMREGRVKPVLYSTLRVLPNGLTPSFSSSLKLAILMPKTGL
jgi:hypothetical protein